MFSQCKSVIPAGLLALLSLAIAMPSALAAPNARDHDRGDRRDRNGYVLDSRYNHNHYYPPRGYAVRSLPRGYTIVHQGRVPYYFHSGVWYRPYGPRFVVVRPPIGLFVTVLPPFYTTIWARGRPYYYADDAYYVWQPESRGYVVTEPPAETDISTQSAAADDLFIYPKSGQSEQQQASDRYECHSWASNQTGFDPTRPAGGVAESQTSARRADYQRAMTACLEARGYSVK